MIDHFTITKGINRAFELKFYSKIINNNVGEGEIYYHYTRSENQRTQHITEPFLGNLSTLSLKCLSGLAKAVGV